MPEQDWVCGKCGRPFSTEAEAVACYNSHKKAVKADTTRETFKMRFKGGKGAPSTLDMTPLVPGTIYNLPARYANFSWFEPVDKIPGYVAPAPKPEESVYPKKASLAGEAAEADTAFRNEVAAEVPGSPVFLSEKKIEPPTGPEGAESEKKLTREVLSKWNKKSLVNFINAQGGEADESLLKAQLVDMAYELASKS